MVDPFLYMVETKVVGTHVTKFFCVDKLVWSKERGKVKKKTEFKLLPECITHVHKFQTIRITLRPQ